MQYVLYAARTFFTHSMLYGSHHREMVEVRAHNLAATSALMCIFSRMELGQYGAIQWAYIYILRNTLSRCV